MCKSAARGGTVTSFVCLFVFSQVCLPMSNQNKEKKEMVKQFVRQMCRDQTLYNHQVQYYIQMFSSFKIFRILTSDLIYMVYVYLSVKQEKKIIIITPKINKQNCCNNNNNE